MNKPPFPESPLPARLPQLPYTSIAPRTPPASNADLPTGFLWQSLGALVFTDYYLQHESSMLSSIWDASAHINGQYDSASTSISDGNGVLEFELKIVVEVQPYVKGFTVKCALDPNALGYIPFRMFFFEGCLVLVALFQFSIGSPLRTSETRVRIMIPEVQASNILLKAGEQEIDGRNKRCPVAFDAIDFSPER